jgi:tetratricopeptide (TPR) repeat protein
MPGKLKVFISTVSSQFKECRQELASDLRRIGCEVKVQEDFQQGPGSLIAKIESYVDQCDRVIAVIGTAFGCEAARLAVPKTDPPRSYTQWEYYFALGERLNGTQAPPKERFVYFASDSYLNSHPVNEPDELAERQRLFLQMIKDSGKHWGEFDSVDRLCRLVLRDGWQMQERPHKPNNLPYSSLGNLFKGREEFIDSLHQHLQQSKEKAAAIVAKQAIHGLGGVGKTRLAVEYAWRFQSEYSGIVFVRAESQSTLEANLAALCEPGVLNLPEQAAKEQEVRVAAALHWFADYSGWLLILDNTDTKNAAWAVENLLSRLQQGHVIITSRISDWSAHIDTRELDVLDEKDAVDFLLERTQHKRVHKETDAADALSLAREMDGLALALEQAGAFIVQKRISIADYLRRWRKQEEKVRTWFDKRLMNYPYSVAVTWNTSFDQLDAQAKTLLNLLCWFAPEPIPRALLEIPAAGQQLAEVLPLIDLKHPENQAADPEDAIITLAGYSLIKWEDGNHAFSLHRLVGEVTRSRIGKEQQIVWLTAVLNWFDVYFPSDPPSNDIRSWGYWKPMREHLSFLFKSAESAGINGFIRLLNDYALFLYKQGLWKAAEPLMCRALAIDEASFGVKHPEVAIRLNNLAQLLQATHRLAEAEPLMRRALAIDEASFGTEHPRVAVDLNNLAQLLQATNRLAEAEPLMRRALAIDEASFGARHPDVAIRLNNLAQLLQDTHRLSEAEPLMRRALAIDEASFGAEHPRVATQLNNLAVLLQATNRLSEAEPLMRRALAIDEASFGAEHPSVARDLNNLAVLLQATHRLAEAEPLMRRALAIDEASFGAEHPEVARDLNNLAQLLQATNRLAEAEPLIRRCLKIVLLFTAQNGYRHPNLDTSWANYSILLSQMGRTESEIDQILATLAESCGLKPMN